MATSEPQFVNELVQLKTDDEPSGDRPQLNNRDELYEAAVDVVVREGRGSVSLLQRALGIGYGRAARLIDYMAEDGIVGPYNGSQAREVTDQPGRLGGDARPGAGRKPAATKPAPQQQDPPRPSPRPHADDASDRRSLRRVDRSRPSDEVRSTRTTSYEEDYEDDARRRSRKTSRRKRKTKRRKTTRKTSTRKKKRRTNEDEEEDEDEEDEDEEEYEEERR